MKKREIILGILFLSFLTVVLFNSNLISAQTSNVCAVMTTYGAWCQDVPQNQVNNNYPFFTSSCASVPDCWGTCVDTNTGLCNPSSKYACNSSLGGQYFSTLPAQTAQCQQGCCLLGDQASFTTEANCVKLSSQKQINLNFNPNINDEQTCISLAAPEAKGACVYGTTSGTTCEFTTRQNCQSMNTSGTATQFYQDFLCTNPNLETNCVKTTQTICSITSDQIYYVDSCGNTANIYDKNQYNNTNYWSYVEGTNNVVAAPDSDNNGDIESANNGNCNYLNGSTCMKYNPSFDSTRPAYGNNICRDLSCKSGTFAQEFMNTYGNLRKSEVGLSPYPVNGETWCGTEVNGNIIFGRDAGSNITSTLGSYNKNSYGQSYLLPATLNLNKSLDQPGSIDTLFICQNGQITTQTYDARQKICVQNVSSNGYLSSYLAINRWQDCYFQNSSEACNDTGSRDCQWVVGYSILKDPATGLPFVYDNTTDQLVPRQDTYSGILGDKIQMDTRPGASCLPRYPPGFDISVNGLLSSQGDLNIQGPSASDACGLASMTCIVNYSRSKLSSVVNSLEPNDSGSSWDLNPDSDVVCFYKNETLAEPWTSSVSNLCGSIGDCGISINYVGTNGANNITDIFKPVYGNPSYASGTSGNSS